MPQIKPSRYSDKPKGYLTYPIKGEKDTSGIQAVLLKDRIEKRYIIEHNGAEINEMRVSKGLWEALKGVGVHVRKSQGRTYVGKKRISVIKGGKQTSLPVEIRKIMNGKELMSIRIRVEGETEKDIIINIEAIEKSLSAWNIKPKECMWSQGAWQELSPNDQVVKEDSVQKEMRRLEAIIAAHATEIAELKERPIKKAMAEDREVFKGVMK